MHKTRLDFNLVFLMEKMMNKAQKQVTQAQLNREKQTIKELK